jgi:hypothetical protein
MLPEGGSQVMKRFFAVGLLSLALLGVGCTSSDKKAGGGSAAACTKCPCPNWTDGNGDGKCDTMVACDHAAADHGPAGTCKKCKCASWADGNGDGKCDTKVACDHAKADHPGAK